jgi:dTDP-4-dehydrorhamnose 3,5-epimerase-like enzyme
MYLCSASYEPAREHAINPRDVNPLDPGLAVPWPGDVEPILPAKDAPRR